MMLLICMICVFLIYIAIHVEKVGHSCILKRTAALSDTFSQSGASKIPFVLFIPIFYKENSV